MSISERRRRPRFPSHSAAALMLKGAWCDGTLIDISLNGALFDLGVGFESACGKACLLNISGFRKCFSGLVVHSDNGLLGIKFIAVGEFEQEALVEIISGVSARLGLLDRDIPSLLEA